MGPAGKVKWKRSARAARNSWCSSSYLAVLHILECRLTMIQSALKSTELDSSDVVSRWIPNTWNTVFEKILQKVRHFQSDENSSKRFDFVVWPTVGVRTRDFKYVLNQKSTNPLMDVVLWVSSPHLTFCTKISLKRKESWYPKDIFSCAKYS